MKSMLQFPFNFPSGATFLREDFILSEANRQAFAFLEQWPEWGEHRLSHLLYLHGPKGAGKTHLAHIWHARTNAIFLDEITPYSNFNGCYKLENIETMLAPEEPLLHVINSVIEQQGFLLITSQLAPAWLPLLLPDLASRIRALPAIEVSPPDDALLHAVLIKHFSDRQLRLEPEVTAYLLTRIERSFAAITSIAELIDKKTLAEKRSITIPLVRELLSSLE